MEYSFMTGSYASREETGICRVSFDPDHGFSVEAAGKDYINPSYVLPHPNGRVFYAAEETANGCVHAGLLEGSLPKQPEGFGTEGAYPCHLALSEDMQYLYASNYGSGSIAVFPLDDSGRICRRTDVRSHAGQGPNPERQEGPHVHFSVEAGGVLFVCDLGIDAIVMYRNEGGTLLETGRIAMPPGSGPRHLALSPLHPDRLYCVAELGNCVFVLERAGDTYQIVQSVSTLPEGFSGVNTAAAIHMTKDGRRLLASNRGHDSIAVFPVNADGSLGSPVISHCVREPRDFMLCDDYVLVGSQRDSEIHAYKLPGNALRIEDTGMSVRLVHPVCLADLK